MRRVLPMFQCNLKMTLGIRCVLHSKIARSQTHRQTDFSLRHIMSRFSITISSTTVYLASEVLAEAMAMGSIGMTLLVFATEMRFTGMADTVFNTIAK